MKGHTELAWTWTASVVTGKVEHSIEVAGYEAVVAYWPSDGGERIWSLKATIHEGEDCINHFTAAYKDADEAAAAAKYHKTRIAKTLRRKKKRADVLAAAGYGEGGE